jgi:hypothetical protein
MHAVVSTPLFGVYVAVFYYRIDGEAKEDRTLPHIEIPCDSYDHAYAVVDAYNEIGRWK